MWTLWNKIYFIKYSFWKFYEVRAERGDFNWCWFWSSEVCTLMLRWYLLRLFYFYSDWLWPYCVASWFKGHIDSKIQFICLPTDLLYINETPKVILLHCICTHSKQKKTECLIINNPPYAFLPKTRQMATCTIWYWWCHLLIFH